MNIRNVLRTPARRAVAASLALAATVALVSMPRDAYSAPGDGDAKKAKAAEPAKAEAGLLVDLGNAKCPVMGEEVNGKAFSEWNGLRIGHCCPMCKAKFMADPEKYLKAAGIEWREAAEAVKKVNDATGADREKALTALKAKWKVVREPAAAPAPQGALLDLGNAKCPVSGEAVDGKTFTEWQGLRVGLCCPDCGAKFLAQPEKLLDGAKVSWRDAAAAAKALDESKGADRVKALAAAKKKYTVVREPAAEPATK
jgi:rubredoxin